MHGPLTSTNPGASPEALVAPAADLTSMSQTTDVTEVALTKAKILTVPIELVEKVVLHALTLASQERRSSVIDNLLASREEPPSLMIPLTQLAERLKDSGVSLEHLEKSAAEMLSQCHVIDFTRDIHSKLCRAIKNFTGSDVASDWMTHCLSKGVAPEAAFLLYNILTRTAQDLKVLKHKAGQVLNSESPYAMQPHTDLYESEDFYVMLSNFQKFIKKTEGSSVSESLVFFQVKADAYAALAEAILTLFIKPQGALTSIISKFKMAFNPYNYILPSLKIPVEDIGLLKETTHQLKFFGINLHDISYRISGPDIRMNLRWSLDHSTVQK